MSKILVTGATGTVGRALIAQLKAQGSDFVAGVRDLAKGRDNLDLGADQVVVFDFADPATYSQATEGVDRVFFLIPGLAPDMDKAAAPFLDYLKEAGITRIVYMSAYNSENFAKRHPWLTSHSRLTQKLKDDGFTWTILEPTFFAQNWKTYEWENVTQRSITYMPAGQGRAAFVDVHDIAAVAALALTETGHEGKTYVLTGPESLSYGDAATLLTETIGKPIFYPAPSAEEFAGALKGAGAPDFIAPYMSAVYAAIGNGEVDHVSPDVERLLGRAPRSLRSVLADDFATVAV